MKQKDLTTTEYSENLNEYFDDLKRVAISNLHDLNSVVIDDGSGQKLPNILELVSLNSVF